MGTGRTDGEREGVLPAFAVDSGAHYNKYTKKKKREKSGAEPGLCRQGPDF